MSAAAAEGDRSENAEYIYRKKELREIERRVRYLTKRLDELKMVDRLPDDRSRVFFGAWFTVADEAGDEHGYRIVGTDEVDSDRIVDFELLREFYFRPDTVRTSDQDRIFHRSVEERGLF